MELLLVLRPHFGEELLLPTNVPRLLVVLGTPAPASDAVVDRVSAEQALHEPQSLLEGTALVDRYFD